MNNPFGLISTKRFGPMFWTQFFGAFNDNAYKSSVIMLITIDAKAGIISDENNLLILICSALFILPFLLFSALAGDLADKYDKAMIARKVKIAEIIIMLLASIGFIAHYYQMIIMSYCILITIVFLMGAHSAFFGPVKYSILPQHLRANELVKGNGLIEMGTFVAILSGNVIAGLIVGFNGDVFVITFCIVFIAVLGYLKSRQIPDAPAAKNDEGKIQLSPFSGSWKIVKLSYKNPAVFLSILGISWFWFYGSAILMQLIPYNMKVLSGNPQAYAIILSIFSLGIGLGSMSCERLCNGKIELGLVPLGAIGMSVFGIDLCFANRSSILPGHELTILEFIKFWPNIHALIDLFVLGFFGGLYIVPLYTFIQHRTHPNLRSRIIAANNIINSFFMIGASLTCMMLLMTMSIPYLFLVLSILNAIVSLYIYLLMPEFLLRFLAWMLIHSFYHIGSENLDTIPEKGSAIIVCNHVSLVDPLVLLAVSPRPIRFVMSNDWYNLPFLNYLFRAMKVIPVVINKEEKWRITDIGSLTMINDAFTAGELVCIFPEWKMTETGEINTFNLWLDNISGNEIPVIPAALQGLWGSFFSCKYGSLRYLIRSWHSKIGVIVGEPVSRDTSLQELEKIVKELRGKWQ